MEQAFCSECGEALGPGYEYCAVCGVDLGAARQKEILDREVAQAVERRERPPLILPLAWLQIGGGLFGLGLAIKVVPTGSGFGLVGVGPGFLLAATLALLLPAIAGGVGMLLKRRWGWWLSGFACFYSAALALQVPIVAVMMSQPGNDTLLPSPGVTMPFVVRALLRVGMRVAVYAYLMRGRVPGWFDASPAQVRWTILQHAAVVAVIFVASYLVRTFGS